MYLRSLEIAGFKSFGGRLSLDLTPGVIGIVGPNGAGKSNLVDAIRWVLGEQSGRTLRTSKIDDVIFNGTATRPKASMAEVSITLDNSNGKMPIEFSEVQITRRLYRSGESIYLLNGRRVRLKDVDEILSLSGFGHNSYSVIGQGMIDSLILSSPAERKLMFDEASGIRVYELQREATKKKMTETQDNLQTLTTQINELIPLHNKIKSQFEAAARRDQIKKQLNEYKKNYILTQKQYFDQKIAKFNQELKDNQDSIQKATQDLKQKHQQQSEVRRAYKLAQKDLQMVKNQLSKMESQRDKSFAKLARARADLDVLTSRLEEFAQTIKLQSQRQDKRITIEKKIDQANDKIKMLEQKNYDFEQKISTYDESIKKLNNELANRRRRLTNNQKSDYILHALGLISLARKGLKDTELDRTKMVIILHKLARVIKLASEENIASVLSDINSRQKLITREMSKREDLVESQTAVVIAIRSQELDINHWQKQLNDLLQNTTDAIDEKTKQKIQQGISLQEKLIAKLSSEVDTADRQIYSLRSQLVDDKDKHVDIQDETLLASIEQLNQRLALHGSYIEHNKLQLADCKKQLDELHRQAKDWQIAWPARIAKLNVGEVTLEMIYKLTGEIELLSDVNDVTDTEYRTITEKLEFTTSQRLDLERAIVDMEKINQNLDKKIMKTFIDAFARINQKFNFYFKKMFDGGEASITLVKQANDSYGVELMVNPPAKKISQLGSLSGGEKALASIALLAAILHINPSPFVVLDEVDAALDDVNSVKFNKILREIASRSQLIVITHNHHSMQQADALVGVAPHPDGDSKLLHVRLEQARQLADV